MGKPGFALFMYRESSTGEISTLKDYSDSFGCWQSASVKLRPDPIDFLRPFRCRVSQNKNRFHTLVENMHSDL
jgi:hypothetical protein